MLTIVDTERVESKMRTTMKGLIIALSLAAVFMAVLTVTELDEYDELVWESKKPEPPLYSISSNVSQANGSKADILQPSTGKQTNRYTAPRVSNPVEEPQRDLDPSERYFSEGLAGVVSAEQFRLDISTYEAQLEEEGRIGFGPNGEKHYILKSPNIKTEESNDFPKYNATVPLSELVERSNRGDPAAMLNLAEAAFLASRWVEGEQYAIEAARVSGSAIPLIRAANMRRYNVRAPFTDKTAASWYLAAYLQGDLAATLHVADYFNAMNLEDQQWAAGRATEILHQLTEQG